MAYERPLMAWLSGERYFQKSPFHISAGDYDINSAWLAIDHHIPLHEAHLAKLRPFDRTWEETLEYLEKACGKLNRTLPGWAPAKELADEILTEFGPPPLRCYAIYMISVSLDTAEKCVYVGQTNATAHRFKSGHSAISALHHPRYREFEKRLYLGGLVIEDDDDHLFPVEWIHPIESRQIVLDSIERRLIFDLQPELNVQGRAAFSGEIDVPIVVQNIASRFLDAQSFGPSQSKREIEEKEGG